MITDETQKRIIEKVEGLLKVNISDIEIPKQGMDSEVFFAVDNNGNEYAIKYFSRGSGNDVPAYDLLKENKIDVPVPKVFGVFAFENKQVLILEKIKFPLLESIPVSEMHRYIPSMIENLQKIHQVKSEIAGLINESGKSRGWKEIMLAKFTGEDPNFDWNNIVNRDGLDSELVLRSVENIISRIGKTEFIEKPYSLLHTDFNQRNLFVDPNSNEITGIIDWGEAMFGDPIYDFARIRMLIWHFDLARSVLENYNKILSFTPEQKQLEELYWPSRIIEYLAYYSEELNKFNAERIKLHQDFLREHKW